VSLESKIVAATIPSYLARNVKYKHDLTDIDVKEAKDVDEAVSVTVSKRKKR
jgi:hypothetical protein